MIRVENIEKFYRKNKKNPLHVLKKINLDFPKSGLISIVGESGSGKTTLLRAISGLTSFDKGRVVYEGRVCLNAGKSEIEEYANKNFAFVFRNEYMKKELSVEQNLYDALKMYHLSEEIIYERISTVLEIVGMSKYKNRFVCDLSGGQVQRIAIARAIVKSPKIIFADEPTGNLDEENSILIMQVLKALSKKCLVILVSHERQLVEYFSDRIIELHEGRIISDEINEAYNPLKTMELKNIYLGDYQKQEETIGNLCVQSYSKNDICPSQVIKIICKNNKLFVQCSEEITVLGEDNDIKVVEGKRPDFYTMERKGIPDLEGINDQYKQRCTLRDLRRQRRNGKNNRKRQLFQNIIVSAFTFFLFLLLINYREQYSVNKKVLQKVDDHIVTVDFREGNTPKAEMESFYDRCIIGEGYHDISSVISSTINIQYDGYLQLEGTLCKINDFSVVSYHALTKRDLLSGRLPKNRNEIVIDRMLLERSRTENNILKELFAEDDSVLGMKVILISGDRELEIVGISDMCEPSIYVSDTLKYSMNLDSPTVATDEEMKKIARGKYKSTLLRDNQVLVSRTLMGKMEGEDVQQEILNHLKKVTGEEIEIVGIFEDNDIEYVVPESLLEQMIRQQVFQERKCQIYLSDPDKSIKRWKEEQQMTGEFMSVRFSKSSEVQLEKEREKQIKIIDIPPIYQWILLFIFGISYLLVVRGNILEKKEEIQIDCLLGMSKRNIFFTFLENGVTNIFFSVVSVVLLSWGIVSLCSQIPSINYYVDIPLWMVGSFICIVVSVCLILYLIPCWMKIKEKA